MIRKSTDAGPAGIYSNSQPSPTPTPAAGEFLVTRTIAPARPIRPGVFDGRIIRAEMAAFPWRQSVSNPDGLVLKVAVEIEDDQGVGHVFDAADATITNLPRIEHIFNAAGLTMGPGDLSDVIGELVGRDVRITTKNITPRAGQSAGITKAVIGSWILPRHAATE